MITPQRQHALRSNFGLVFLACVALLAPPLALAQECVAREVSCCAALLSSKGFNMNPLGPLKLPSASAATHCTQTCVFSEKVAINNAASVTTTFGSVAGGDFAESQFSTRILNDVDGTPSACGASLDENTNRITLEIGTYLIEGICPFASSQPSACRLAKIDANTGAVVETLAVGTQGICRPPTEGSTSTASGYPRVANNAESTFLAHEVTFTEAATVVLQSFLGDALVTDMNGGYANVANDRQNHGLSGAFGARLSVRKIPQSRAGSTCVLRESSANQNGPTATVNGYTHRALSLLSGNSTTCGASFTDGGLLALTSGTYLVRVRASALWNHNFASRIQQMDGNSLSMALPEGLDLHGHPSGGPAAQPDIVTTSDVAPFELVVTEPTAYFKITTWMRNDLVTEWIRNGNENWGAGIGQLYGGMNVGYAVTLTQVSVRKLDEIEVGRTCVAMEQGSDLFALDGISGAAWTPRRLNHLEGDPTRCGATLDADAYEVTLDPGFYVVDGFGVGRGVDSFEVSLFRLSEPRGDADEAVARSSSGYAHKSDISTNARAIIPPTEIVVPTRTTFRLEQWNRFANPGSNAQSFGKLVTETDGTISGYEGDVSEVVNAQLRIERLVHEVAAPPPASQYDETITNVLNDPVGTPIRCTGNDVGRGANTADYRYMGGNGLRWYPDSTIARSYDSAYMDKLQYRDCENLFQGKVMPHNVAVGSAVKCTANHLTSDHHNVYRVAENEVLRPYPTSEIASSWDPAWGSHQMINCIGLTLGVAMTKKPTMG